MSSISAVVAPIIDRLVVSVHRQLPLRRYEEVDAWKESVGLERIGLIINMRPFILAHSASEAIALQLHRYQDPDDVLAAVGQARQLGLFEQEVYMTTETGHVAAETLTSLQSDLMEELWADHGDAVAAAQPLVAHGIAHSSGHFSGPDYALFHDLAALPVPEEPAAYRLHHQLTVLRYLRSDIHAAVLAHAGLQPAEARELTIIWKGQEYEPNAEAVAKVIERGLVSPSGDALTPEGIGVREKVEAETNEANDDAFEIIAPRDKNQLIEALESLPWE